jgi:tRNA (guanine-N7-)-methyltransferase
MRMRNLPWAKDYLNEHDIVIKDAEQKAGSWKQFLNCDVLHVEIGTGKGDYWTKMSSMYPQFGWIGIEKNTSVAALAVKKYDGLENKNSHMAFIQEDAADISKWFGEKEIDVIHLNFSDPWPKKRAHKKRLSSDSFIKMYDQVLADDGEIQMKTDNEQLFEFSILAFQNAGWKLIDFTVNYRRDQHDEDAITEYETRFMNLGQPIFRAV